MSIVSGVMGASATKSAANTAAGAQVNSTAMGVEATKEMFDKAVETLKPYVEAGYRGLAQYEAAPTGVGAPSFPGTDIPGPKLPGSPGTDIPFTFNPNDELYKIQREEGERAINRSLAARGAYNSRMGVNALSDFNRKLAADETANQYGRAVDKYGRDVDKYNRDYSAGLDEYGRSVDKYGREYSAVIDKYNIDNALVQQNLNKWFALANIGRGTSTAQGGLGTQAGGQINQAYQGQGNALANVYSNEGNQLANVYGNVVPNAVGSAYYGAKAYNAYTASRNNQKYYQFAAGQYGAGGGASGYGNWAGGTLS